MSNILSDYDPRRSFVQQNTSCAKPKHKLQINAEKHRRISQGVVYNVSRHSGKSYCDIIRETLQKNSDPDGPSNRPPPSFLYSRTNPFFGHSNKNIKNAVKKSIPNQLRPTERKFISKERKSLSQLELSASLYINLDNSALEDLLINEYNEKLARNNTFNSTTRCNESQRDNSENDNDYIPLSADQYEEYQDTLDIFGETIESDNSISNSLSRGITFSPMRSIGGKNSSYISNNSNNNGKKLNESRSEHLQRLMDESDEIFNSFDSISYLDDKNDTNDKTLDFTKLNLQNKNPKRQLINFRKARDIAKLSGLPVANLIQIQMDIDYNEATLNFEDKNLNRWLGNELGIDFDAKAKKKIPPLNKEKIKTKRAQSAGAVRPIIAKSSNKIDLNNDIFFHQFYSKMNKLDCIISIEYCSGCKDHLTLHKHDEQAYLSKSMLILHELSNHLINVDSTNMNLGLVRIEVIGGESKRVISKRPLSAPAAKKIVSSPIKTKYIEKKLEENIEVINKDIIVNGKNIKEFNNYNNVATRIGACEVQICVLDASGKFHIENLHSKLKDQNWPDINIVKDKVSKFIEKCVSESNILIRNNSIKKEIENKKIEEIFINEDKFKIMLPSLKIKMLQS